MEKQERVKKLKKEWKLNNQEKVKLYNIKSGLKRFYNVTIDDYNRMYNEQEGKCVICGKHQSELKKSLSVDHSHKTNKIRGLLCNHCNLMLGNAFDDVKILEQAIIYLKNK